MTGLSPEAMAVRAGRIGASEVAAVLGISPYEDATPFAVWSRIVHGIERTDRPWLTAGRYLEDAVAAWYLETHAPGFYYRQGEGRPHPEHDWLSATPDRVLETEEGDAQYLVECKTERDRDAWGEPGTDQVPVHVAAQVQCQLAVMGLDRVVVPVLFKARDEFQFYDVRRDDAVIAHLITTLGAWYQRHVVEKVMPDLDGGNAAAEFLRRRYPGSNGALKTPTPEQAALVAEFSAAKAQEKDAADRAAVLRQRLIFEIADSDGFALADGGQVTFRATKAGNRVLRLSGPRER